MSEHPSPLGRIAIAGGSGFVGLSLTDHLCSRGASVVVLSRRPPRHDSAFQGAADPRNGNGTCQFVEWDGRTPGEWTDMLNGADGLINLAGRSVDCIKTPDHQDEILRSRVESTRVLGRAMQAIESPPPVWVQMGTAHIYGDPPEVTCTEETPFGYGLAPFVAQAWEEEFCSALLPSQRGVILRTSFVLGRDRGAGNGALARLLPLARLGLGGRIGRGRHGMSWIHETDLNRLFERGLRDESMQGVYIASSPHPVSQREFMRELRRGVGMPIGLPVFPWMVRVGARCLLRTDPDLALYGRYVVSTRLAEEGFEFQFPHLGEAFADLLTTRFHQPER
jgi:uncharacterized protein